MNKIGFIALSLLFSATLGWSTDLTITFKTGGKGMLGAKSSLETHYYTSRYQMVRNEGTKVDSLVDYERGVTYSIDHTKQNISMIRMEDALAVLDTMGNGEKSPAAGIMGAMFGDPDQCTVTEAGSEVVAGRSCTIHKIVVGKLNMVLSADPTLKAPVPAGSYMKMMRAKAASMARAGMAGASYKRLYEEMGRVKGIPLKTAMSGMMGVNATSEATQVKAGSVPASTFTLPDYPIEDMGKKMREQMEKSRSKD